MQIIIEFDALTDFRLNWLRCCMDKGKWQSAEDILGPLIHEAFDKAQLTSTNHKGE